MNLVQFSDAYGRETATNMLWYCDTAKGGAQSIEFGVSGACILPSGNVAKGANPTGAQIRDLDFVNRLRNLKYNLEFCSRQEITMDAKSVTIFLPLNAVLGSHRDIVTVMLRVMHAYILERSSPDNYIHRAVSAAAGKFNIEHLSVWMPKVRQSISLQMHLKALLVAGAPRSQYFEQVRVYRHQFGAAQLDRTWRFTSFAREQLPQHVFVAFACVGLDGRKIQNIQVFATPS